MSDAVTITKTMEFQARIPERRNMFRFPHHEVRLGIQSRRIPHDPGEEPINMLCLAEKDFDERDITILGQPQAFCILSPGLAVCWPTTDADYLVTVFVGAE